MTELETLHLQLTDINAAIKAVLLGGQEYKLNDMQVEQWGKRPDLKVLKDFRDELRFEIDTLENPGGFYVS